MADLAELDVFSLVVVGRGPQDDQPDVALVHVDLGPQVECPRVFHGQLMEPEAFLT
jgi:hypothetical protein